jgi:hypothetical protein
MRYMNADHRTPVKQSTPRSVRTRRLSVLQLFVLIRRDDAAGLALGRQFAGADALPLFYRVIGLDLVGFEAGSFVVAVGHFGLQFVLV